MRESYKNVAAMLADLKPIDPVYCVYPHVYCATAEEFLAGFPGRVLYAIKANNEPKVLQALLDAGIEHIDCASLQEIREVRALSQDVVCYFMNPVRLRGAARTAQQEFGVNHFVVDHAAGLKLLLKEIDAKRSVIFVRLAVHHKSARVDLSSKFGASAEDTLTLLQAVADSGAEPALAFNVGSQVMSPDAYVHSIETAIGVLERLPFKLRLIDIGGGYAKAYPGFAAPPMSDYFAAIVKAAHFSLLDNGELMAEPGRALAAPGCSAIAEVLLRKDNKLYLNDGLYGVFWELRYDAHDRYPARAWHNAKPLNGPTQPFQLLGPTCDSDDKLPGLVELPVDIQIGDYIEFGSIGAYSLGGRCDFNGFYSNLVFNITDPDSLPPG
ncbi:MAG: type III PLP-dependent enzyme [Proteobacteria bacterium]|nr:type III PLP-dependent enzyme [Pseudomonadota bacterium]